MLVLINSITALAVVVLITIFVFSVGQSSGALFTIVISGAGFTITVAV